MSIGQPCKHCTHGKMRPIHFSWDQAVVLCDNNKCKSILDVAPSECIIKRDFLHCARRPFSSAFGLQDLLSESSSGVYSETRSSLPSPAQSRKSVTDEEVESLLKASYAPLSFKDCIPSSSEFSGSVSHTQASSKVEHIDSDQCRYDGFFELLNDLDLEPPVQPLNTESQSESTTLETGLDVVATELEGWLEDFDFPTNSPSSGDERSDQTVRATSAMVTTNLQGPSIPSQSSAFSPVDTSKEEYVTLIKSEQNSLVNAMSYHTSFVENNETSKCISRQCKNSCFSTQFENELMKKSMSDFHTRFISPTASAASEDSGYNEEDGKASTGLELVMNEESLKISPQTMHSSLKNIDNAFRNKLITQAHQNNFKNFIQDKLEWPAVSSIHTLTVLPAMVTTEKNFVDNPRELSRSSSVAQATDGSGICIAAQDGREGMDFSTEQQNETSQIPSGLFQGIEHRTVSLENCESVVTDESHAISIAELSHASVLPQPSECIVSEESSHSTFSEARNILSENVDSASGLNTSCMAPLCYSDGKSKRERLERSKSKKFRESSDSNTRNYVPPDKSQFPDPHVSLVRERGKGRGRKKGKGKYKAGKSKRKSKRLMSIEGRKQAPSKKLSNYRQTKRPGIANKVLPRSARHHASFLKDQLPSSSGENQTGANAADELHDGGDNIYYLSTTTQNSGWQTPEGETNHHSQRASNLSPRKHLMGQVNEDPWSVMDLCLEELAIEVVVQGDQREMSRHPGKAAKHDVQLQQMMSLFCKEGESEVSHFPASSAAQDFPSKVCETKNGELPFKGRYPEGNDIKEKKINKDDNKYLNENIEQNTKDLRKHSNAKILKETEQENLSIDAFHRMGSRNINSRFNVISECKGHTSIVQENSRLHPRPTSPNGENPSAKLAMESGENEGSTSLIKEEKGFIKQQLVTNNCEDCQYTPSEEKIHDEISSEDLEITQKKKQSFDKELTETGNGSIRTENSEDSEQIEYLFTSINQDVAEKSAFESIKRQCISENYNALKSLKVSHFENSRLNEVCDENMPIKSDNVLTEKLNVDKPETNIQEQSCNIEVDNISESPSTSPEASPQYFPNPPKCETVRNWIGYKDDMSIQGNECRVEEEIIENSSLKSCPNLKLRVSSSKYFQSLVKDMDFDEDFFQCPVQEHPSKTFSEHLKSSLFFGETAGNSPSHIRSEEVPLDFKYKDCSQSDCISKSFPQVYDHHLADSKTSAVSTQVLVPLSSSVAQDPVTSVATDISSCKVPPIVREKLLGKKILIVPNNAQLRYIVTSPVMNSNSTEHVLSSSSQPFQNLMPKFLAVGSSGEGIGGKKPDCVSESRKHDSKWGNYIFAKSTGQRLSYASEFTGISGAGVRKKLGNNSNSEHIKSNSDNEDISALSHSPVDTADKESRLGVSIKTEWTSKSFPANFTGVPSPNSVSLMQTKLHYCLDRVNEDCKTCDCNSGYDKPKIELDLHCKEHASCTKDFFSNSSVDANKLSVISLDSDNEIHGTVLGRASECGLTSQTEKDSSCVNSDENYLTESCFVNDDLVNQCNLNAESVEATFNTSEMKDLKASLIQVVSCGSKRKADDQNEALKKQRLHDMFTDIQTEEYTHKHKIQSAANSNSQCGSVMCGILDHSILHDEHCCSSSHQDFQDFVAPRNTDGESPPTVKVYAGPSKHCGSNKCGSNYDISNILKACVAKESIYNYYSVCSNAKEITSYTFQDTTAFSHDFQFGCMKTGPQFDSSSCLRIEKEVNDLDFFQLDSLYSGFLVPLISSTESHVLTPEPVQEQSCLEHCTLQESCALEYREKETISKETSEQEGSVLNEETKKNPSNHASKPSNDNSEDRNVYMAPLTASHTSGTNLMSRNLSKFTASFKEAKPLVKLICNDNIIFTEHAENYNHSIPDNTSIDTHTSQERKKIYLLRKSSQSSQLVSSHQSDASEKNSCITSLLSVPSMSSDASSRLSACGPHLKNQCVTGAVVPHSHLLFPALHSSENVAPHAWAMASSSFACRDKGNINLGSSDIQKQTSLIDYQILASTHPPTVVPPALVASYAKFPLTVVTPTPVSLNCMKYNKNELPAQSEKKADTREGSSMLKKVKLGSTGFVYLRPTPALKNAISEMRKKENTEDKEEEESSSGYLTLPDGNPIPPPIFIPSKKNEVQLARHKRKRARKRFNKKMKDFVEEKVKESLESSRKNEIPKIIVIYTKGNLHLCQIDVVEDR